MVNRATLKYFTGSFWLSALGLAIAIPLGYSYGGLNGAIQTLFIVIVLSVLEVSLSFDNAVVNAVVLKDMTPKWRQRFLTWGIAIAVFGMRLIFPLAIIAIVAKINPWSALMLAVREPQEYERIMMSAHVAISSYGGTFLLMVGLKYFFDREKEVHWIKKIEAPLSYLGRLDAFEIGFTIILLLLFYNLLPSDEGMTFLTSGLWGLITFIAVDGIGSFLKLPTKSVLDPERASVGMFLYLEVLDASFSFDGVIGAFALTNNLFIMMIGLGIGALFVRSMTIMLVDRQTLSEYRYLEHGAFWAILALAACMYLSTLMHIPEVVTGLIGAVFIGLSFWSSVRHNRKHS
jgi:uncharacterized protein